MTEQHTTTSPAEQQDILAEEAEELAKFIVEAAIDKKGLDIVALDVRGLASYTDFLVICTGRNDRHVKAIAQSVEDAVGPYRTREGREGQSHGHWTLLDYGEVIVHVFYAPVRKLYDLEKLWNEAERLDLDIPDELVSDGSLYAGYETL